MPGRLEDSKVLCLYPWTFMEVRPSGEVRPCCPYPAQERIGHARESSLTQIWNSEAMKGLRAKMLQEEPLPQCEHCYLLERAGIQSFRQGTNERYAHDFPAVATTLPDGTLPAAPVRHLSLWLSNVCNFRCRICGPNLSTAWYADAKALGLPVPDGVLQPDGGTGSLMRQIEPLLDGLEELSFVGGEPLLVAEAYELLKLLVRKRLFHVRLNYTTNFSQTSYEGCDAMELWDRFEKVHVSASLDGSERRGEYLRKGQDWEQVLRNRERMFEACPRAEFMVTCTVCAMNAWHAPDFHRDWRERGLVGEGSFLINVLTGPEHYHMQVLPRFIKEEIAEKYRRHAASPACANELDRERFAGVPKVLLERDLSARLPEFRRVTRQLDALRGEDFAAVFPELSGLMEGA